MDRHKKKTLSKACDPDVASMIIVWSDHDSNDANALFCMRAFAAILNRLWLKLTDFSKLR